MGLEERAQDRPDRDRFQRPYVHSLKIQKSGHTEDGDIVKLTIEQASFRGAEGFASTVWDSSIVVAKMLERNPDLVVGRAVLDLSAGCGLVAIVAARLGARRTVATDLSPNLPLLQRNCERNGAAVEVMEHWWGSDTTQLLQVDGANVSNHWTVPPTGSVMNVTQAAPLPKAEAVTLTAGAEAFAAKAVAVASDDAKGSKQGRKRETAERGDGGGRERREGLDLVIACDVMYQEAAMGPLVATLAGLCGGKYDGNGGSNAVDGTTTEVFMERQLRCNDKEAAASVVAAIVRNANTDGEVKTEAETEAETETEAAPVSSSVAAINAHKSTALASAEPGSRPTTVILAHGRNRFAEAAFWRHATAAGFRVEAVPWDDLDPVYRCTDVDVYRLRLEGGV
ncbi:hypothetical protein Vretimale_10941 [Volvox reticuliferus]|uniref:Methyltransferase small domain-containing protein n=1 Tax=Volvox reticuliferus TaxID=1737510 RepID=A0A8J4GGQ1_9CHLO|nr:hypothetical protein Vretimale_10941 [Volvox reticuliferus]